MSTRKTPRQPEPDSEDTKPLKESSEQTVNLPLNDLKPMLYSAIALAVLPVSDASKVSGLEVGELVSGYQRWLGQHPDVKAIAKVS